MTKKSPPTLLQEIQEQPALLRELLRDPAQRLASLAPPPNGVNKLLGVAEGSSKHALEIAAPFLEEWTGLPVWVHNPEALEEKFAVSRLFEGRMATIFRDAYFLVVSQSGETASVLKILDILRRDALEAWPDGPPILTLTNRFPSTLSERFGNNLLIGAGEEKSIAATKTLTASILSLMLWGLHVGRTSGRLSEGDVERAAEQLASVPPLLETLWENNLPERLLRFSRRLMEVNHFVLLSKGILTLILPEIGLKLTETSSNIVYTDNSESFKHGPKVILSGVQGLHPNSIYLVPPNAEAAEGLFRDMRSHFWVDDTLAFEDDRVFFVTFENSPPIPSEILTGLSVRADQILTLPAATPFQSLFLGLVAFQTISYHLAVNKGENPDNPALEKAVTE